jgi:hypothetical protein
MDAQTTAQSAYFYHSTTIAVPPIPHHEEPASFEGCLLLGILRLAGQIEIMPGAVKRYRTSFMISTSLMVSDRRQ